MKSNISETCRSDLKVKQIKFIATGISVKSKENCGSVFKFSIKA